MFYIVDLLISELRRQDALTKVTSSTFNSNKCKHLDHFQKFVSSLGIPGYNFWIGQNSKQLKWRTLTGPEKLTFFWEYQYPGAFAKYTRR